CSSTSGASAGSEGGGAAVRMPTIFTGRERRADLFTAMVRGNRVTLLHDGAACLSAMLGAIESARREILFEMYWFASDRTGRRFAEALAAKARAGLRVCVIYDA